MEREGFRRMEHEDSRQMEREGFSRAILISTYTGLRKRRPDRLSLGVNEVRPATIK